MMDKESPEGLHKGDDDALNAWLASAPSTGTCRVVVAALLCGVMFLAGCAKPSAPPAFIRAPIVEVVATLKPMKILAVGDSITYGADDGTSWRADMDVMLRARGIEPIWIVAALGGSGCDFWVKVIRDLVRTNRPDIVLISCGTNDDQGSAEKSNTFLVNHLSLILHSRLAGAEVGVSGIQVSRVEDRPSLAWLPRFQRKTNPLINANVARFSDVAFADVALIPATVENNPDGVHPGPAGMALYAAAWISAGARQGWWAP